MRLEVTNQSGVLDPQNFTVIKEAGQWESFICDVLFYFSLQGNQQHVQQ